MSIKLSLLRVLGDDRIDINTRDINVGLGYLAAYAEQVGAETSIYDPAEISDYEDDSFYESLKNSDVVGFSIHCLNIKQTLRAIKKTKKKYPKILIIVGGHHAGACAQELLDDHPEIDVVCIGDGEYPIQNICSTPEKFRRPPNSPGIILRGGSPQNLDLLLTPSRKSIARIERISTSRGCPYKCKFCTTPGIISLSGQAPYRCRSISKITEEIFYLHREGARHFYINDDIFVTGSKNSRKRAEMLADEILSFGQKITYKAQLRADSFDLKKTGLLEKLHASGMTEVFLGIESGSNRTLSEYGKDITRETNKLAIMTYKEIGIKVNAGNIPASPNALLTDFLETVDFFAELEIAFLLFRRVSFKALVLPGTEIEKILIASERIERNQRYFLTDYQFLDPLLGRLVKHLETRMPHFLKSVGGNLFSARNDCSREIAQWSNEEKNKFNLIMRDWSFISHEAIKKLVSLVKQHIDSPERVDIVISDYSNHCIQILHNLTKLRGRATTVEMSGDLF